MSVLFWLGRYIVYDVKTSTVTTFMGERLFIWLQLLMSLVVTNFVLLSPQVILVGTYLLLSSMSFVNCCQFFMCVLLSLLALRASPESIHFSCSAQLSMKIFQLIDVKIQLLAFNIFERKNRILDLSEPEQMLNFLVFLILISFQFHAQLR